MLSGGVSLESFTTIRTIYKEACFLYPYKSFPLTLLKRYLIKFLLFVFGFNCHNTIFKLLNIPWIQQIVDEGMDFTVSYRRS